MIGAGKPTYIMQSMIYCLCPFLGEKFIFLKIIYFRQRGREGERGETHQRDCLSHAPYWGPGLTSNPGMCPNWELNRRPFGLQSGAQSIEPHQPGQKFYFLIGSLVMQSHFQKLYRNVAIWFSPVQKFSLKKSRSEWHYSLNFPALESHRKE